MRRALLVLSAAALDWILGDPENLPHPVRAMGWAITRLEQPLRRPQDEPARQIAAGAVLTALLAGGSYGVTWCVLRGSERTNAGLGAGVAVLLASSCVAARNLDDEARSVLRALGDGDLAQARLRVARIVGRDTQALEEPGVARALIETVAESLCDGIVAPLFYLAVGGVPFAMLFKAISTLDSMIGHRDLRYLYFGRVAARLDDAANWIPARLTAMALLALWPARLPTAAAIWKRDARRHASPNAGHPEAAMAGILGVQLGGTSSYAGELIDAPLLNAGAPLPTLADARRAVTLMRAVAVIAVFVACAATWKMRSGRR